MAGIDLNVIQLVCGLIAAICVFIGIFISVRRLDPGKKTEIPVKITVLSCALIVLGLLIYAVTKTCTYLQTVDLTEYDLYTVYFASLGEVVKVFGFFALIPIVLRLFGPRKNKKILEEIREEDALAGDS